MAKRYDIRDYDRGRQASRPRDIPKAGWRDILLRTKSQLAEDNIGLVAAGVAFYALLALFPAMAAMISVYGLVADPADVERQAASLMAVMPAQAADILKGQLHSLASQPSGGLGVGVIVGLLLTLWSASKGTKALMQGLNIAYDERERRGWFRLNGTALLLTLGGILFSVVALALIAVLPVVFSFIQLPSFLGFVAQAARWVLLAGAALAALAVVYRYAPSRDQPKWRWVSWGSGITLVVWLAASVAFSVYVANFGSYGETYGTLGAVVILMTWLYLSAYMVLIGGELNAEIEHQTARDTTKGPERPMGSRDAKMADTVGRKP